MSIYIYCSSIPVYNNTSPRNLQYCGYIPFYSLDMDSHTKAKKEELREEKEIQKIDDR